MLKADQTASVVVQIVFKSSRDSQESSRKSAECHVTKMPTEHCIIFRLCSAVLTATGGHRTPFSGRHSHLLYYVFVMCYLFRKIKLLLLILRCANLYVLPGFYLNSVEHWSGAKNGAEWAKKSREQSGAVSGSRKKRAERSAEREVAER